MTESTAPVAVVTGGARGIGLASARWFLAQNYCVALWDIDRQTLARTEAELDKPARVLALACDVSSPAQVGAATERTLAAFGRVDALINNAGIAVFKPILDTRFAEWQQVESSGVGLLTLRRAAGGH